MKKRVISLILALLLLVAVPGLTARAYADASYFTYKIVSGDKINTICTKNGLTYNDTCKKAIIKLNGYEDDEDFSTLYVGKEIKLPASDADAAAVVKGEKTTLVSGPAKKAETAATTTTTTSASGDTQVYTIKSGDTAISICKALGLDFVKCKAAIMKLNNFATDYSFLTFKAGNKLVLPASDAVAAKLAASTGTATGSATATTATTTAATGTVTLGATDGVAAYLVPHVVKAGETIYGICVENGIDFAKYFNFIMQASGITYATSLRAGNVLYLPSTTASSGSMSIVSHTVRTGETTYGICQDLGINYGEKAAMIASLNPGKNLSAIRTGQVLLFPAGSASGAISTGTATGTAATGKTGTATAAGSSGYGGGYTPAAAKEAKTPEAFKAKEGVLYYLKEITIAKDDTAYALVKAAGFDYTTYYADVLLSVNNLSSFNGLKEGNKILMLSSSAAGAKYAVTGVKVKDGDTVIKMCDDAGISYSENMTLIAKLNSGLNFNNLKTGDIVVLPKKA